MSDYTPYTFELIDSARLHDFTLHSMCHHEVMSTTTAHISNEQGDQTLCGRNIHDGTTVDTWQPGQHACDDCAEVAASRTYD